MLFCLSHQYVFGLLAGVARLEAICGPIVVIWFCGIAIKISVNCRLCTNLNGHRGRATRATPDLTACIAYNPSACDWAVRFLWRLPLVESLLCA